ncbi:hypothetical protein QNO07_23420 [Streptomyces sp. 549]|uniref:hypothetical protein n=1 Tax=Streptomyces sp. 549 TaxID=3049076 RepID=UPI0024C341D3|nr:hypothetical protein [Streptomyces sp. 549]MDK1476329.1 hypothetical protein [Streptomyces sp. 549]
MEYAPAVFAGVVCASFGAGLLLWTAVRVRRGEPVAVVERPAAAAVLAAAFGVGYLTCGMWLLMRHSG